MASRWSWRSGWPIIWCAKDLDPNQDDARLKARKRWAEWLKREQMLRSGATEIWIESMILIDSSKLSSLVTVESSAHICHKFYIKMYLYTCMHMWTYVCGLINIYIYIYIYTNVYIYICKCIYIYDTVCVYFMYEYVWMDGCMDGCKRPTGKFWVV